MPEKQHKTLYCGNLYSNFMKSKRKRKLTINIMQ